MAIFNKDNNIMNGKGETSGGPTKRNYANDQQPYVAPGNPDGGEYKLSV